MLNNQIQSIHRANQKRWNTAAQRWAECADSRGIWQQCHREPSLVFTEHLLSILTEVNNKRVCVLGSGDQQAVFALAGMGATVTSVDISQKQLDIGTDRADQLGLDISFIRQDVIDLHHLADASFDVVYTGGHVAVWVADLQQYYAEASRILVPGGQLIIDEYHPFRRIWQESKTELKVGDSYFERGPFRHLLGADVLYKEKGDFPSYEFHWTVSDFINAVIQAGCQIQAVKEYGTQAEEWEGAPMTGLPECLLIVAHKQ